MRIAAEAWRLREAARRAILSGEFELALELAGSAQRTQATPAGEALLRLAVWQFRRSKLAFDETPGRPSSQS
jgi:hypothetical protein